MKQFTFLLMLCASMWMVSCGNKETAKPAHTEDEMIAAAKAVDAKFIEAINKEDLDGVMSCYWHSPDLEMMPPGDEVEIKGWEASKESFAKFFAQAEGVKHEMSDAQYKLAGDYVIGWGKVTVTMPGPDSAAAPMVMHGRYTEVLAMKDSNLVYILDHASIPMPPQPHGPMAEEKKK